MIHLLGALSGFRIRSGLFLESLSFTVVDPGFHADHTVSCASFGSAVVDVGAKRMQRHAVLAVPLGSSDFGSTQATGNTDLDALDPLLERGGHALLHRAT